jgi:hypothetical protein
MTTKHFVLFLLLSCWWVSGCEVQGETDHNNDNQSPVRTYYDSLDLETPETAVETFVAAFQQHDFVTVYMILSPAAQQTLTWNKKLLKRDGIVTDPPEKFQEALYEKQFNLEHIYDTLLGYDLLLAVAAEHGALQIYLPGAVTIINSTNSVTPLGQSGVDVATQVEGINGEVVFRMVQSPGDKWRVLQVIWPGGDPTQFPWAVKSEHIGEEAHNLPQIRADNERTYYDSLDLSSPEATVRTFTEAFSQKDFPTVFWILYPNTQINWSVNFAMYRFESIVRLHNRSPQELMWVSEMGQNLQALEDSGVISRNEANLIALEMTGRISDVRSDPYTPLVMEHIGDTSYLFDQIMLAADEQYLIELHRPITILETTYLDSSEDEGETIALVSTLLEGIDGEVVFRLKQAPSGRWRVLQVVAPGGDEEMYPWAVPRQIISDPTP